ncbi:MAG: hypothetical protein KJO98_07020 [Rhodothermia bacterium]|nr:hypothetical protein [Rhodothermia bacterium]
MRNPNGFVFIRQQDPIAMFNRTRSSRPAVILSVAVGLMVTTTAAGQNSLDYYQSKELADAGLAAGRYEESAELYTRLLLDRPDDPELLRSLWAALYRAEALNDALVVGNQLHDLLGSDPNLSYSIARLHATAGNFDDALTWLGTSLAEGLEDRTDLAADESFARLRDDSRFREMAGLPSDGLTRNEGWLYDLEYLVEEAQRLHADPERPAFSKTFLEAVDKLGADIPTLTDEQMVLRMMQLAAILGDGHTAIYGPSGDSPIAVNAGALPVLFYLFSDGLYVVDAVPDWNSLIGARVERIGALAPLEALERLHTYRGVDNAMTMTWLGVHFYLRRLSLLKGIGAVGPTEEGVTLVVARKEDDSSKVVLEVGQYEFRRKLRPPAHIETPPRYLRNVDANYWMESIPDRCSIYFQFNQVRNEEGGPSIEEFSQQLAYALHDTGSRNLIVDVRHNNGGNNSLLRPLVRVLVDFDMGEDHRLLVITGRNTFSAAQNFVNRVERLTDAVFVGEPSSSSPNFVGEETNLHLPWSRLRGSMSSKYWQDSDPGDRRPWISPDVPVALSAADYFSGVDPVMDAIDPLLTCVP